ncbi:hypothetical protein DAI22_04g067401 [Oryza sativa Japonica Group]|nr:hypothetical protein DAI22_04g067401 [Oryza sativa Japonica Group]
MHSASLARAGCGPQGTWRAAGVGFAQGLQRGCTGSQREPGVVGLALSLRASALAGGGGFGLARRTARPTLQAGDMEAGASALQTTDRAAPVGRGGYEGSAGRGRASGRGGAEASVSFAQPCSEIRGQRKNGRLGGDDFRLASYVFDGMPARKERGKRKRERWGAGPLAGGVQGAWAH